MQPLMNQDDVREALKKACAEVGSQNAWARKHSIAQQYVSEVARGTRPPSGRVLAAVGLKRVFGYAPADA